MVTLRFRILKQKDTVAKLRGPIRDLTREMPVEHGSGPRAMTFGLPPVRLVADFRASVMGIKLKSPSSVPTVSIYWHPRSVVLVQRDADTTISS